MRSSRSWWLRSKSAKVASFIMNPLQIPFFGRATGSLCRWRAHEVALGELNAALPDDVVGGGGVKPEVWQAVAEPGREGDGDVLALGAVDLALLDALQVFDGLSDAVLQLSNGGLVVGELQQLLAGETPGRVGGVIGRGTHLPRQIEHVGRQPHIQKIGLIYPACGRPGRGLVEDGVEPVEVLNEDW